ncbi:UDP-N-acetylglucosamine/UDP-glucose/GDP-mannose transporter [Armadillidium nasatum]|uniref:UDP-N-acetylglucosamine/UDP-glucose/GDP-mannose transporter n=1 Tax=Armadillidium nasatum TaxID=96803 RepID=A0A5N5SL15_9CRUS|nr:UDP-N-acetylglucosamine/UDP-glucose/GDP-mannose transporter [Armadillidium nasatum]
MSSPMFKRLLSALFYGVCSFLIVVVNKTVLTSYKFPSFQILALGQMIATILVLFTGRKLNFIDFPSYSKDIMIKIWPLPILYVGNLVFGLGGTKRLRVKPSIPVQLTVYSMIFGSMVAAVNDLAFDSIGYIYVLANDFFTAANGVYVKQKLESKELGKYGLMFYNSLFMVPFSITFCFFNDDFGKFCMSCIMGFILMYSIMLCTQHNSALTTTIIGCLKNILVTYLGIIIGGDYVYTIYNFVGLNISILGSVAYSWITFRDKGKPQPVLPATTTNVIKI